MIWLGVAIALALIVGAPLLFGAPYVPSKRRDVEMALSKLYKVSSKDVLVDIGSGDGVVLRETAKRGARAVGYEINPLLAVVAKLRLGSKAVIYCCNGLKARWPADTTVVYVFGVTRFMPGLERKVREHVKVHGKTVRVISYGFRLPGLKPERELGPYLLYKF